MGTRDGYRCCGTWECRLYFILKLVFLTYTAVFWFYYTLSVALVVQLAAGILALIFKDPTLELFNNLVRSGLRNYYNDLDLKNFVDFVQIEFRCCGADDFRDWAVNEYHNCSSPGQAACGVPFSCCNVAQSERMIPNTHCGYGTLKKERLELVAEISVRGCTHAVLLWFRDHLISMAALLLALIIPQLLGIVTTHFLIKTINKELQRQQQQQQNDSVDGMLRLPLEFDYKGCCPMYIPREELPHKTARQVIV
uniref:tetraspanin-15-like isoform X3 n=1 Tax=Myxine glutinosa TaxID=7769 RepID=UPI00358DFF59